MTPNPAEQLQAARAAWQRMVQAESQVARLDSYRNSSRAMRADRTRWSQAAYEARAELTLALSDDAS